MAYVTTSTAPTNRQTEKAGPPSPLAAGVAAVALLLLLVLPLPDTGRAGEALLDLLHAPAFAVLGFLVAGAVRARRPNAGIATIVLIWLALASFGTGAEYAQRLFDRHSSWQDALANALGAGAGLLWSAVRRSVFPVRLAGLGLSVVLILVAGRDALRTLADSYRQSSEMPLLGSFEHELELSRWSARECRTARVKEHATDGGWSLRLDLQAGRHPGAALDVPPPDWSPYEELVFDLFLEDGPAVNLIVKVADVEHEGGREDRFERRIRLSSGPQRIVIPLSDVAAAPESRRLDLRRISLLQIFAVRLTEPQTLYLDNVRLRDSPEAQ